MQCKNCENSLRTDYSYCPDCGAKVIRNRITLKNLWYDIVERYFNLDNTFLKTFLNLIKQPEVVVESYISGTRRKYLNPVSYIAIALFISSISLFIMRKFAWDKIDFDELLGAKGNGEGMQEILEFTLEYSSLVNMMYVPVIAFCGYVLFNRKKYNLSEHVVVSLYSFATFSIFSSMIAILWLLIHPKNYFKSSYYVIAFMMLFTLYVYIRTSGFGKWSNFLRSIGYALFFAFGFFGVGIILNILFLALGIVELKDFLPQK